MRTRQAIARSPDGRELMLAVKVGSPDAFNRLAHEYGTYIRNVIGRYVKESSMIDDLSQDVLLRLYGARERYEPAAPFEAFLQTIIFNLCVNHLRYHKRRRAVSLSNVSETGEALGSTMPDERGASPDQDAIRRERAIAVREAISRLPGNQQRALLLSHFDGLAHDEVGRRVGLSVAAVKSLIWRARENLRKMLGAELAEPADILRGAMTTPRLVSTRQRSAA